LIEILSPETHSKSSLTGHLVTFPSIHWSIHSPRH